MKSGSHPSRGAPDQRFHDFYLYLTFTYGSCLNVHNRGEISVANTHVLTQLAHVDAIKLFNPPECN